VRGMHRQGILGALQAEIAEERFMLRRSKEENEILRSFFIRYKNQLGDLQVRRLLFDCCFCALLSALHWQD